MKCGVRVLLCLTFAASATGLLLLFNLIADYEDQYGMIEYIHVSIEHMVLEQHWRKPVMGGKQGDKVIVMARMESENTDWVAEELPDWQRAIYTVNPSEMVPGVLTTPTNKGHEAMAYLTYIIDHYDSIPSTIAFLHAHRSGFFDAWHVDTPMHDNVAAMQSLHLPYVQRNGYVNLRCNWNPGCIPPHLKNQHITRQVFQSVFEDTSTPPVNETSERAPGDRGLVIPNRIGAACCAQFAVSRGQVLERPLEDYIKFRDWIMVTALNDAKSGRIMEYLWHVIFGKEAVYCPDEEVCYCEVYGRC